MSGTTTARVRNSNAASANLYERAKTVMPGGSTRATLFVPPFPPYAYAGKGTQVTDIDGNIYTDFANNFFSLIHGHCHPEIVDAVIEQAKQGLCFSLPTETEVTLAEAIAARSPVFEQVRFANTGTEAVMTAIHAARAFTGRTKIAKIEGGYHGFYDHAQVSLDSAPSNWGEGDPRRVAYTAGTPEAVLSDTVVIPFNDPDQIEAIIDANAASLAAVLFDLAPSRAGMIPAQPAAVGRLREVTARHGILLILDEIVSFRLGWGGAHTNFGLKPDLVTLGKVIGGGLPVGAIAGRADVMSVFNVTAGRARVPHGGTFTANPLTMAAGIASLRLLPPEVYTRLEMLGERLRSGITAGANSIGVRAQVTGIGSLFRVHLTDRRIDGYRASYPQGTEKADIATLRDYLRAEGYLVTPNVSGAVSTVTTETEVDSFVDAVLAGMDEIRRSRLAGGGRAN
jgi:glutamate-1-semialdehyde 2,1-aminomutase